MTQIDLRECASAADEQISLDLHNTVWPHQAVTLAEVHAFKSRVRDVVDFLALIGGEPVGSAVAAILPQRPSIAFALSTVLPERRRLGVGTALYEVVSSWARDRGLESMWAPVEEDDPASLAFAARRGFVEVERTPRMRLELPASPEPQPDPPAGIEITLWSQRPELAQGIYEVAIEAYADVPGAEEDEMESFTDWLAHDMGGADDAQLTFVALAGDDVVGYAKLSRTPARPGVASHEMTAVKRVWRGRGIARALKCAQISWAIRSGLERLETSNEVRNAPIRHLNRELGYRPQPGRLLLQGPLDNARGGNRPAVRPAVSAENAGGR